MPNTALPKTAADYLASGDVAGLIEYQRARWGDLRMEADPDGDDEEKPETGKTPDGQDDGDDGDDDARDDGLDDKVRDVLRKERKRARDAERARKAAEKERDDLRQATESETERKIREAKTEGRTEAAKETAAAMLRMALKSQGVKGDDLTDAVEDFNLSRAISDGQINEDRITSYAARFGTKNIEQYGDSGHGRGTGKPVSAKERAAAAAAQRGWATNDK